MKQPTANLLGKESLTLSESDFKDTMGHPLQLAYTSFIIALSGTAVVTVNFKNYLLKPYSILVLGEDAITVVKRVTADFRACYGLIDKSLAAEVAYDLPNQLFLYLHQFPFCKPEGEDVALLQGWIAQLKYIKACSNSYQHTLLRNMLQNFFLAIAEAVPLHAVKATQSYSPKEILCWKFWELIVQHSHRQRTVAFYANQLHITPYYLSQISKDFLNDSPKGLIDRQVILKIKSLLRNTDRSIKQIADYLSFEDTSYMARYFKKQTGKTLSAYRK